MQLHAPLKPHCSNHSDNPYPILTFHLGTGATGLSIVPTLTKSYIPALNYSSVAGPTVSSSYATPILPTSYPYGPLSPYPGTAPLSTGASSSYAVSPSLPSLNTSTSSGDPAYPTYGYTFSLPPFIPSTIAGPTTTSTGSLLSSTGKYSGSAVGPLSTGGSSTAPYGNETTIGPTQTSSPSLVYPYSFTFPDGTSPVSTSDSSKFGTISITVASISVSNSAITPNTSSTVPYGYGPSLLSSYPVVPVSGLPTIGPVVTGTAISTNPSQANDTTARPSIAPTYPYTFSLETSLHSSISASAAQASSIPIITVNTTAGPAGTSPALSYGVLSTFSTVVSPAGASSETSCTESTTVVSSANTSSDFVYPTATPTVVSTVTGITGGTSSGVFTAPLTVLSSSSFAAYSYTPVSVSVPTEYFHHHRRPHGREHHVSVSSILPAPMMSTMRC